MKLKPKISTKPQKGKAVLEIANIILFTLTKSSKNTLFHELNLY